MKKLFAIISLLALCSCEESNKDSGEKSKVTKYSHVEKVFVHEPGRYSILVRCEKDKELVPVIFSRYINYRLFDDVPFEEPMWAIFTEYTIRSAKTSDLEIHIHSLKDLNGGGWDHGKEGKGTTNTVE